MSNNEIGMIGGLLVMLFIFGGLVIIAMWALSPTIFISKDENSIPPNSTVDYAGAVGIWTNDVMLCSSCKLAGHKYQQGSVCIRCGSETNEIVAIWSDGEWVKK